MGKLESWGEACPSELGARQLAAVASTPRALRFLVTHSKRVSHSMQSVRGR